MINVMFVCLGNICRSPTAHGIFQQMVVDDGLADRIQVASSGTSAYHIGEPPDGRSQQAASQRGYDLSWIRAQQVTLDDLEAYDYILAMDKNNLSALKQLAPVNHHNKLKLFMSFAQQQSEMEVPDPYYGGANGFAQVLDLVEMAAQGLLQQIKQEHPL
ncbi:low molecular weight phosphotyrosine protein phosphatase [Endozoicomonas sp. SM1973]|uniref:protein-tyrosine-phosphatase n=2 Tax=Spartinivicinus marinus TaxID=2994442 RepID=A0A853HT97_9GAMM|nr:low molecular weight protein-tyrosine-phosphatase [Spartinivicinus marinus]MCX4029426.1 low molecular weight phosphotyrosine protein phosphatase [Spartinivicinus marinus]NYZ65000.1 low molecular weight phosphotyrosine protein phosphatase [Spartinivicinus marinus]